MGLLKSQNHFHALTCNLRLGCVERDSESLLELINLLLHASPIDHSPLMFSTSQNHEQPKRYQSSIPTRTEAKIDGGMIKSITYGQAVRANIFTKNGCHAVLDESVSQNSSLRMYSVPTKKPTKKPPIFQAARGEKRMHFSAYQKPARLFFPHQPYPDRLPNGKKAKSK